MKKLSIMSVIVLLSFFGGVVFVNASTITYDFRGFFEAGKSLSFTVDDFTVTATGFSGERDSYVNRTFFGLGVSSWILDNPQVDGRGPDDGALLSFSGDFILKSATFSLMGPNDDFRLIVDGTSILDAKIPDDGYFDFTNYLSESDRIGSSFGFSVTGFNDDYMLASIEVAQVPIPSSIILLSASLVGLAAIRRRFKR